MGAKRLWDFGRGMDQGPAGPRGEGFYVGYLRDLDGNKLCVFQAG